MGFLSNMWNGTSEALSELYNRGSTLITGGYYLGPFNSLTPEYIASHPPVDRADAAGLTHDLDYTDIAKRVKNGEITQEQANQLSRASDNKFLTTMRKEWTTSPWKTSLGYMGIKGKNVLEDMGVINPNIFVRMKRGGMVRRLCKMGI